MYAGGIVFLVGGRGYPYGIAGGIKYDVPGIAQRGG